MTGQLVGGDRFTVLGEQYASAQAGTGLTLTPFFDINDGNGGANYTITLVDNSAGEILQAPSAMDLAQLGGNVVSRLNGDSRTSSTQRNISAMDACERSVDDRHEFDDHVADRSDTGDLCAKDAASQTALIQVRSSGIRLPRGLAPSEALR